MHRPASKQPCVRLVESLKRLLWHEPVLIPVPRSFLLAHVYRKRSVLAAFRQLAASISHRAVAVVGLSRPIFA